MSFRFCGLYQLTFTLPSSLRFTLGTLPSELRESFYLFPSVSPKIFCKIFCVCTSNEALYRKRQAVSFYGKLLSASSADQFNSRRNYTKENVPIKPEFDGDIEGTSPKGQVYRTARRARRRAYRGRGEYQWTSTLPSSWRHTKGTLP